MPAIIPCDENTFQKVMETSRAGSSTAATGTHDAPSPPPPPPGKLNLLADPIQQNPTTVKGDPAFKPFSALGKLQRDVVIPKGEHDEGIKLEPRPLAAVPPQNPTHRLHEVEAHYSYAGFCTMLEAISDRGRPGDRLRIMENFWKMVTSDLDKSLEGKDIKPYLSEDGTSYAYVHRASFFPFLRLVLPHLDSTRSTYGLKESKIAQYYTKILQIPLDSPDAQRLIKWKDPTKSHSGSTSFSDVLYTVLVKRGFREVAKTNAQKGSGSIRDVNETLDALSTADSPERKKKVFTHIIRTFNALEQKWLIRIIVKDMKLHISHASILGKFHPLAMSILNNTTDLEHVCKSTVFIDPAPEESVKVDTALRLFGAFKPMLASLIADEKLLSCLTEQPYWVEPKYDGERILIHFKVDRSGERVQYQTKFLTRNSTDYTDLYGPKFSQAVQNALSRSVKESCIIDGELLVFDGSVGTFKRFGTNKTFALDFAKRGEGNQNNRGTNVHERFCYMAFDVVHLNGNSLLQFSLDKRRAALIKLVQETKNEFEVVPLLVPKVHNVKDVLRALDEAVCTMDHEGIILKNADSLYVPGERKLNWLKLKRDHIHGLADTLDLAVLGAYHGTKFGKKGLSHFLLGVWREEHNIWETFTKVGTGYNRQELDLLNQKLEGRWLPYNPAKDTQQQMALYSAYSSAEEVLRFRQQMFGDWKPAADDVPDVFIHPDHIKNTVVFEVIGYEFTETIKFKVGHTFRFPRVRRIRADKNVEDATNYEQLVEVMNASIGKKKLAVDLGESFSLTRTGKRGADDDASGQRRAKRARKGINLLDNSATAVNYVQMQQIHRVESCLGMRDDGATPNTSTTFTVSGTPLCFCVLQCESAGQWTKDVLEMTIRNHGGQTLANPSQDALLVASSPHAARVKHWRTAVESNSPAIAKYTNKYILHHSWVVDSILARQPLPCAPRYVVYASPELTTMFSRTIDQYGDAFFTLSTPDSFKAIVAEKFSEKEKEEKEEDIFRKRPQKRQKTLSEEGVLAAVAERCVRILRMRATVGGWSQAGDKAQLFAGMTFLFLPEMHAKVEDSVHTSADDASSTTRLALYHALHHGAMILDASNGTEDLRPTHIVSTQSDARDTRCPVVSCKWVLDSAGAGVVLPTSTYECVGGGGGGDSGGGGNVLPPKQHIVEDSGEVDTAREAMLLATPCDLTPELPGLVGLSENRTGCGGTAKTAKTQKEQKGPALTHQESVFPDSQDFAQGDDVDG